MLALTNEELDRLEANAYGVWQDGSNFQRWLLSAIEEIRRRRDLDGVVKTTEIPVDAPWRDAVTACWIDANGRQVLEYV